MWRTKSSPLSTSENSFCRFFFGLASWTRRGSKQCNHKSKMIKFNCLICEASQIVTKRTIIMNMILPICSKYALLLFLEQNAHLLGTRQIIIIVTKSNYYQSQLNV